MGIDEYTDPNSLEILRRSIAMLATGQTAALERDRALALVGTLQRLQQEHGQVVAELRSLLARLEAP